jgi:hypothetical protein
MASHLKKHALDSTLDHEGITGTADNLLTLDANGLPKDSGVLISTDGTLASNSDVKVATEKAVKTYVDANSGGSIPQVSTGGNGSPIGLLLTLTQGIPVSYQFSYRTQEGTTKRVTIA